MDYGDRWPRLFRAWRSESQHLTLEALLVAVDPEDAAEPVAADVASTLGSSAILAAALGWVGGPITPAIFDALGVKAADKKLIETLLVNEGLATLNSQGLWVDSAKLRTLAPLPLGLARRLAAHLGRIPVPEPPDLTATLLRGRRLAVDSTHFPVVLRLDMELVRRVPAPCMAILLQETVDRAFVPTSAPGPSQLRAGSFASLQLAAYFSKTDPMVARTHLNQVDPRRLDPAGQVAFRDLTDGLRQANPSVQNGAR